MPATAHVPQAMLVRGRVSHGQTMPCPVDTHHDAHAGCPLDTSSAPGFQASLITVAAHSGCDQCDHTLIHCILLWSVLPLSSVNGCYAGSCSELFAQHVRAV
jgi:hypothetical protein